MKIRILLIMLISFLFFFISGCELWNTYVLGKEYLGNITIVLTLSDLSGTVTFNKATTPANEVEYAWGVYIDTDNNTATGRSAAPYSQIDGCDVEIVLEYIKIINPEVTSTVAEQFNTDINDEFMNLQYYAATYTWDGASRTAIEKNYVEVDGNTITIYAMTTSSVLAETVSDYRAVFATKSYGPPLDEDVTSAIQGNNSLTDPSDAANAFIDILSAEIQFP